MGKRPFESSSHPRVESTVRDGDERLQREEVADWVDDVVVAADADFDVAVDMDERRNDARVQEKRRAVYRSFRQEKE